MTYHTTNLVRPFVPLSRLWFRHLHDLEALEARPAGHASAVIRKTTEFRPLWFLARGLFGATISIVKS